MVASHDTTAQVLAVLRRHLPEDKIVAIMHDLSEVPGNGSFVATVRRLYEAVRPRAGA